MNWTRRGTIRWFKIPAICAMVYSLAYGLQVESEDYVLRLNSNLVVLDVSVTGPDGVPVAGIAKDRFRISEDGKAQTITQYSANELPVTLGFVVDISGSMFRKAAGVNQAVNSFLKASNSDDYFFVVGFNDQPRFGLHNGKAFTDKPNEVRNAMASFRPIGRTSLYDGVSSAIRHIQDSPLERRVLILVSDGKDTASRIRLDEALRQARASRVTIFTIGLFDVDDADQNGGVLKQIARVTGGQYFHPENAQELNDACLRIARDIRARYTLAYVPKDDTKTGLRRIKVEVVRGPEEPKRIVRTRTEYTIGPVAQH